MTSNVYDIVVLSSSPPPIASSPHHGMPSPREERVAISPSPALSFSPTRSLKKATAAASFTPSRGAAIPEGVIRGFATVGSLVRSEHFADQPRHDSTEQQLRSRRTSGGDELDNQEVLRKPPKNSGKKRTAVGGEKPKSRSRARKSTEDKQEPTQDTELRVPQATRSPFFDENHPRSPRSLTEADPKLTKSGKPRRPRTKKQDADLGGKEHAPKSQKPRAPRAKAGTSKGKTDREDTPVVSAHFCDGGSNGNVADNGSLNTSSRAQHSTLKNPATIWEIPESPEPRKRAKPRATASPEQSLDLDEAVARRRDWTPPVEAAPLLEYTNSSGKENGEGSLNNSGDFTSLLSAFTYAQPPAQRTTNVVATSTSVAITKRRRVEVSWLNSSHFRTGTLIEIYSSLKSQTTRPNLETLHRKRAKRQRRRLAQLQIL